MLRIHARLAALALPVAAAAAVLLLKLPVAEAQPEVTAIFPKDGEVLSGPPPMIRICFADPVNVRDPDDGGDFGFKVEDPEGNSLGLRIVFKIGGLGVDLFPGHSIGPNEGEWHVEWHVTDPETLEPTDGELTFTVGPEGSPVPEEPPISCAAGEPADSGTPAAGRPDVSEPDEDGSGGGGDTLLIVIVAGAVGGAALALLAYRARRRRRPN